MKAYVRLSIVTCMSYSWSALISLTNFSHLEMTGVAQSEEPITEADISKVLKLVSEDKILGIECLEPVTCMSFY